MVEEHMHHDAEDHILVLVDEDNNEHEFVIVEILKLEKGEYAVLEPLAEEDEEDGAVVFKIVEVDGEEQLIDIDDEDEWNEVVDYWNALVDAEEAE